MVITSYIIAVNSGPYVPHSSITYFDFVLVWIFWRQLRDAASHL